MTVHNYRSRQVHKTLNGVNPSSSFRDMRSAKSGPNLWQIWQVFCPWASPYGANGQMTMTVHIYRPRQVHRTSNGENPSSSYRDMSSASLAAARPPARPTAHPPTRPPTRPPARTVTTIPLQPEGLRGKNPWNNVKLYGHIFFLILFNVSALELHIFCTFTNQMLYTLLELKPESSGMTIKNTIVAAALAPCIAKPSE